MPNTHQQHPEDTILSGDLRVIRDLYSRGSVSLKIDGAPAVVWGHYQGKSFVCTKAAFNKKKVRLCYDTNDINTHFGHQEDVANMLFLMLKFLDPDQFPGVYQGDFMGFGGTDTFKTNTLTYVFPEVVSQKLVIAPHTVYTVGDKLSEAVGSPLTEIFTDDKHIKWCQPSVDYVFNDIEAPKIDLSNVNFMTQKESFVAQQQINALIASGQMIEDRDLEWILGDIYLTNLYQLVTDIKDDLMSSMIVHDAPKTYLPNGYEVVGEGFVFYSESGRVYKLVDRPVFSYTNFTEGKFN